MDDCLQPNDINQATADKRHRILTPKETSQPITFDGAMGYKIDLIHTQRHHVISSIWIKSWYCSRHSAFREKIKLRKVLLTIFKMNWQKKNQFEE